MIDSVPGLARLWDGVSHCNLIHWTLRVAPWSPILSIRLSREMVICHHCCRALQIANEHPIIYDRDFLDALGTGVVAHL